MDDPSAEVTVSDGALSATMLVRFDQNYLIESVYAEGRDAEINGELVPTPSEERWTSYERRDNMLVPTKGDVAWLFPVPRMPYWRGTITEFRYTFAEYLR